MSNRLVPEQELPLNWATVRLGDSLTLANGFAFKPSHWKQEGLPIIRIQNLNNKDAPFNYCSDKVPDRFRVENGDLLFAWSGTPGTSFGAHIWQGDKAWLNQHIFNVRFDKRLFDVNFLRLAINQNLASYISSAHGGAGLAHITKGKFEESTLLVAPLKEQRRIVAEIEKQFSRLDDAVKALRRVKANLKRYRASILKAACEGRLVPTEAELARKERRDYEPASELLKRILTERRAKWEAGQLQKMIAAGKPPKDDEWKKKYKHPGPPDTSQLAVLPNGWIWTTWEQVSPRVTVGHVGPMKHQYVEAGISFLRSQNVRANRFEPDGLLFIPEAFHRELSKSLLIPGDLVVVRSGSVGTTCVIPDHLQQANCSDLVIIKKPLGIVPEYGAFYMNSNAQRLISAGKVGVALIHFNTQSVAALPVPMPPASEQNRIVGEVARRLSTLDNLETIVRSRLNSAIRLRQTIISKAFSGKLVLQDPNDEPASVLLERIRVERTALATKKENQSTKTNAVAVNGQRRRRVEKLAPGVSPGKVSKKNVSAVGATHQR